MPLISVIIPTYNRAAVLPRAIDSVLAQSATRRRTDLRHTSSDGFVLWRTSFGGKGADFELIIVDDGSTDDTRATVILTFSKLISSQDSPDFQSKLNENQDNAQRSTRDSSYEKIHPTGLEKRCALRVVRCAKNKGPAAARNLGIKEAKGEWIAFLDSDDEWKPGKLKAQLEFFEKNPDYLICQTEEIWIRNGTRVNPMKKHQKFGGFIFEKCLPLCVVSPSAAMISRKLFDEVGLFDESLPACEDYDLWLRIAAKYPIGLIEKPYILKYGGHADQRSRQFPAMDQFRIRSLAKILESKILSEEQTAAARKTLEEKAAIFIQGALKRGKKEEAEEIASLAQRATVNAQRECKSLRFAR